ncbi:MAG: biotin/lipoyl-binding protein [Firmicutes bacterium]|nr:biotin/lipoyl-binding protein [Bacillota bacterium]
MKRFRVTVNGQPFEVTVEENGNRGGTQQPVRLPAPPQPPGYAPQPAPVTSPPTTAAAPRRAAAPPAGAITAPLPGLIVAVKVEAGQSVDAGQVLMVLEAMKMENDIVAPGPGVVKEILVEPGTAVAGGQALLVLG